jgi:hypothetical protein
MSTRGRRPLAVAGSICRADLGCNVSRSANWRRDFDSSSRDGRRRCARGEGAP